MSLTSIADLIPPGPQPAVTAKLIATLLPAIEAAIAQGFSHLQVHALLAEHGIEMELNYYHDVIYRLRKRRRPPEPQAATVLAQSAAPTTRTARVPPGSPTTVATSPAPETKATVLSVGIGSSVARSGGNISSKSSAEDKFSPRNARDFDIKDI